MGEISEGDDKAKKDGGLEYIKRQVFPHAPSPTMTNFLRMDSAIVKGVVVVVVY